MVEGNVVSFKKKIGDINKQFGLSQLKLSPSIKEVPIPDNTIKNNIPDNTIKNNIPDNTIKNNNKSDNNVSTIENKSDTAITDALKETNIILQDIRKNAYNSTVEHLDVYKRTNTIPVATPIQPPDDQITNGTAPGYIEEPIHDALRRNADRIVIRNQGPGELYVIYSSSGTNEYTRSESFIQEGDSEAFLNVYAARLRSPTAGLQYDITETEIPVATTTVTRAEKIETYYSSSIFDFIAAVPINGMAIANITPPLLANKYTIRGINIQSVQQIDFDLIFFSSAIFDTPGVLDTDTFLDSVELDMTAFPAFRINNANQWRLAVSNLVILYEDTDLTNTLHVGLLNLGPIPKLAGAAGAVQIDFKMSPRA
jgi:hypothetical protein